MGPNFSEISILFLQEGLPEWTEYRRLQRPCLSGRNQSLAYPRRQREYLRGSCLKAPRRSDLKERIEAAVHPSVGFLHPGRQHDKTCSFRQRSLYHSRCHHAGLYPAQPLSRFQFREAQLVGLTDHKRREKAADQLTLDLRISYHTFSNAL
mgnify:CR=1 FL=1